MRPFHRIEEIHYVDADTGAILETVQMRRFYDEKRRLVREYPLDREPIVNPGFRP